MATSSGLYLEKKTRVHFQKPIDAKGEEGSSLYKSIGPCHYLLIMDQNIWLKCV